MAERPKSRGRKSRGSGQSSATRRASRVSGAHRMPENMERVPRGVRDVLRLITEVPLLVDLHERERAVLAEIAEIVRCPGGTVLYEPGQSGSHLYVILQGRVEIRCQVGPGIYHTVRYLDDGDVAGIDAALGGGQYDMQARATDKTAALRFRTDTVRKLIEAGQPAGIKLFVALSDQLGQQIRQSTSDVVRMLAKTTMQLAAKAKKRDGEYDASDMKRILGG